MRLAILILAAVLLAENVYSLNEKQIAAAVKLIRNTCKTKSKATDEMIDSMHKGTWDDNNEKAKCYYHCCLAMMKIQKKNGAFDLELAVKLLDQLPEARLEPMQTSMKNCENAGEGLTHKCDLSYSFFKCMYHDNPEGYILP